MPRYVYPTAISIPVPNCGPKYLPSHRQRVTLKVWLHCPSILIPRGIHLQNSSIPPEPSPIIIPKTQRLEKSNASSQPTTSLLLCPIKSHSDLLDDDIIAIHHLFAISFVYIIYFLYVMELSPPALTRSPVSPRTSYCSSSGSSSPAYPSPELLAPQYRLISMYDQVCGMGSNFGQGTPLPPLDVMTSADWSEDVLLHSSSSAGIPNILSAEYDPFASYEQSMPPAYGHNAYPAHPSQAPMLVHSPQPLHRTLSHSPDPAGPRNSMSYSYGGSPAPRIKVETAGEFSAGVEVSQYPSPGPSIAMPLEADSYGPTAGGSDYLSEGAWPKPEYEQVDSEHFYSGPGDQGASLLPDRRSYRSGRSPRRQPRRLTTKEEANFQCQVKGCGKLFSRSYNYKAHLETHDDRREYPFPCTVDDCNKRFVRKTDLSRHHQSVHMKERNHKCEYCARTFARKDTLRR